jgi:3-hydroxybutyrate dehydrogenase
LAELAASKGWQVIVTDPDRYAADETARTIVANGGRAEPFALDVTSADSIQRVIEALGERRVDVLINNAGLQYVASLEDFPEEQWDLLVRVMLNGTYLMTRAVLPGMRYDYVDVPRYCLWNKAGLPAAPFDARVGP